MKKEIICTVCPRGCTVTVDGDGKTVQTVEGYGCKRGLEYASAEYAHPVRILTTTVRLADNSHDLLPVRSAKPLPKEQLFACMEVLRQVTVEGPVAMHQVIVADICGTGVDMVATKAMEA